MSKMSKKVSIEIKDQTSESNKALATLDFDEGIGVDYPYVYIKDRSHPDMIAVPYIPQYVVDDMLHELANKLDEENQRWFTQTLMAIAENGDMQKFLDMYNKTKKVTNKT